MAFQIMALPKEERVELVLLNGREGCSCEKITDKFNVFYQRIIPIGSSTVMMVIRKLKETSRIVDKTCKIKIVGICD